MEYGRSSPTGVPRGFAINLQEGNSGDLSKFPYGRYRYNARHLPRMHPGTSTWLSPPLPCPPSPDVAENSGAESGGKSTRHAQ